MDDSGWTPRIPLVAAERRVDFPGINSHIRDRRAAVEKAASPAANRLAYLVSQHNLPTARAEADLEESIYVALVATIDFGYRSVRRELASQHPGVRAALSHSGIGEKGRSVLLGLPGVHGVVRSRAALVAHNVGGAARSAAHNAEVAPGSTPLRVRQETSAQVRRTLHNGVLAIVSEALNLGRAVAAQEILAERGGGKAAAAVRAAEGDGPPEYCMRSEQLDENTCNECDLLHGEIYLVGSGEYYDAMPPAYCEGEGRCRGLYIYGESSEFSSAPSDSGAPPAAPQEWSGITDGPATEMLDRIESEWGDKLSDDEKQALLAYRFNDGAQRMNTFSRTGEGGKELASPASGSNLTTEEAVRLMDQAIENSASTEENLELTMYRGIQDATKLFGEAGPQIGDMFIEQGYTSTTTEFDVAARYLADRSFISAPLVGDSSTMIEIRAPAGIRGAWMRANEDLVDKKNYEYALARGAHMRVVEISERSFEKYDEWYTVKVVTVELEP